MTSPLTNAANWKSLHMAYYRYMTHADPAPPVARNDEPAARRRAAIRSAAGWGENIAYGYGRRRSVMTAWLNSSGHRANIENASFRAIGVAAAASTRDVLLDAGLRHFADGGTPPPPPPPPPTTYACSNGMDDDGDAKVDYPADPGCSSTTDNNEYNAPPPCPHLRLLERRGR